MAKDIVLRFECDGYLVLDHGKPTAIRVNIRPPRQSENPLVWDYSADVTYAEIDEAFRMFDEDTWAVDVPITLES